MNNEGMTGKGNILGWFGRAGVGGGSADNIARRLRDQHGELSQIRDELAELNSDQHHDALTQLDDALTQLEAVAGALEGPG